jgi:hypothetical protein
LGKFRAITVGLQVGPKVSAATPVVMQLLLDPPVRESGVASRNASTGVGASNVAGASLSGAAKGAQNAGDGGATPSERALPAWLLYGAAAVLLLALGGLAIVLALSRKKGEEKQQAESPTEK